MHYFALDIETCGLDVTDSLLEISVVFDNGGLIGDLPHKHIVLPQEHVSGHIAAMQMHVANGLLAECLKCEDYGDWVMGLNSWIMDLCPDRPTLAGKNISSFDWPFLKHHACERALIETHHRMIDVGSMYLRASDVCVPSLKECCSRAGVVYNDRHRAYDDCLMVVQCVRRFLNG